MSGISIPAFYQTAAAALPTNSTLTIAQGLTAFPQYSSVSDVWGANVGNFSYHSLQFTLQQRTAHGLNFNVNYTYSKNIGDDGNFRSGFAIPARGVVGRRPELETGPDRAFLDRSLCPERAARLWRVPGFRLAEGTSATVRCWCVRSRADGSFQHLHLHGRLSDVGCVQPLLGIHELPAAGHMHAGCGAGASNARINGSYGTGPNERRLAIWALGQAAPQSVCHPAQFQLPAKTGPTVT